jgi:hypothetical protein
MLIDKGKNSEDFIVKRYHFESLTTEKGMHISGIQNAMPTFFNY